MPNSVLIESIIVAHEGNWVGDDAMCCHVHFRHYEDVQKALGFGLNFVGKEYSTALKRSLFKFNITSSPAKLVVPATGEEIRFEIYGVDYKGTSFLLTAREL